MPTYEYECAKCGLRFDRFHGMTENPPVACPACGGSARKLIGTGGGIMIKNAVSTGRTNTTPGCDRSRPCCGRSVPCDSKPCGS